MHFRILVAALIAAGFHDIFNVTHGFEGDLDDTHHRGTVNGWPSFRLTSLIPACG